MTTATHDIDESVSHIRQLLDTAKATQRPSDARLVDEALRMLEAEELLAVSERRVQIGYRLKGGVSHDALAKLRVWVDEAKRTQRSTDIDMVRGALTVIEAEETLAKIVERAERRRQTTSLPPGYTYVDATTLGHSIDDFAFKAPDGRVYGPYVNKASMHGDAWTHATDPDLFIAPTPGADELLTPEEYEAALASDLSETDLYHIIDRAMSEALELRSPFFRVSVPSAALERAKAMLVKWDVRETGRPAMRERGSHLVHLKVSPKPPAFEVFLVGDVVVVAEDAANAALLGSNLTALIGGFKSEDARQVDSSEVLSVWLWDTETRDTTVTKTAGEWAKSSGRGVLGPISGSPLDTSCCDDVREHGPFQLYFVGPSLYVAASEDDAAVLHTMSMAAAEEKLQELLDLVQAGLSDEVAAHTKGFLDQLVTEIRKPGVPVLVDSEQPLPAIIEYRNDGVDALGLEGRILLSTNTYAQWVELGRGSHGVLQSFYEESVMPQVEALLLIAAELGTKRIIETRNRLTVAREDNGGY